MPVFCKMMKIAAYLLRLLRAREFCETRGYRGTKGPFV